MKTIVTITGVRYKSASRCFGWLESFGVAKQYVEKNNGDISENGYYTHCVIEKFGQGVYPQAQSETWFKWNGQQYIECSKPIELKDTVNWGIG